MIPRRIAQNIIRSLTIGVVPNKGVENIAVGRSDEIKSILKDYTAIKNGDGSYRYIVGRFGSGKTFLKQWAMDKAVSDKFVVMNVELDNVHRLTGGKRQGLNTYRELIKNIRIKGLPEGSAIEFLLTKWKDELKEKIAEEQNKTVDQVSLYELEVMCSSRTRSLDNYVGSADFRQAISKYIIDMERNVTYSNASRWLKGEYTSIADVRNTLGMHYKGFINDDNWYDYIKLWARFVTCIGYKGLILFIDEEIILYKINNPESRKANYQFMFKMLNDIIGGYAPYLGVYFCSTPDSIEDHNRGCFSLEELRQRLVQGKYEGKYESFDGPLIKLKPLKDSDWVALLCKVSEIYMIANAECQDNENMSLSREQMIRFIDKSLESIPSKELLTPRELCRDFISVLNTIKSNPGVTFEDVIEDIRVEPFCNPDLENMLDNL